VVSQSYTERVAQEVDTYRDVTNVSDLPDIFSYWSERFLLNKLKDIGIDSMEAFYSEPVIARCSETSQLVRVASIGSGNGETEVELAQTLFRAGFENLEVICLEMNSSMQERARRRASDAGVLHLLRFVEADFNEWEADGKYDAIIASHSLHHVVALEHLFAQIHSALSPDGVFLVNDMIGRNGHMRWPEALRPLRSIWAAMPERYKYNHQLRFIDHEFDNHDCSDVGFEGIRAQDILPLLLNTFHPERFLGFANIIGPFVDRGFGHNFDLTNSSDTEFIERVAQLDDLAIDLGMVKPTQMIASFLTHPVPERFFRHRSARFCVRNPEILDLSPRSGSDVDDEEDGDLRADRDRLQSDLVQAQQRIDELLGSRSWRYSEPFRVAMSRLLRRR
jgi:SAM-dependent methyltransferase